jgi:CheY-like chemotaxis protein
MTDSRKHGTRRMSAISAPPVILLAEDLESDVLLLQRALRQARIVNPVKVVNDGEQAIAYLKGEGKYADRAEYPVPSLLLLDLKMPRLGGLEVLSWAQNQPGLKDLRIVVLSGSRELEDVNRAYQLGAHTFLVKPTEFDQLVALMQALQGFWIWTNEDPGIGRPSV